jgi:hypothetical protein
MNSAAIIDGIDRAKKLLRMSDIGFNQNSMYPVDLISPAKLSDEFIRLSTKRDYDKIHRIALENGDYDLLLEDYSFFQFTKDDAGVIRYAYYQTARDIPTYSEFLESLGFSKEDIKSQDGGELPFINDYDQAVSEAKLCDSATPIRYDYNEGQYVKVIHPTSHIHIGHENEVRIPLKVILSPQSFVAFIIRHIYYDEWKKSMIKADFVQEYLKVKNSCHEVDIEKFDQDEKQDLYIL